MLCKMITSIKKTAQVSVPQQKKSILKGGQFLICIIAKFYCMNVTAGLMTIYEFFVNL